MDGIRLELSRPEIRISWKSVFRATNVISAIVRIGIVPKIGLVSQIVHIRESN